MGGDPVNWSILSPSLVHSLVGGMGEVEVREGRRGSSFVEVREGRRGSSSVEVREGRRGSSRVEVRVSQGSQEMRDTDILAKQSWAVEHVEQTQVPDRVF